MPTVALTGNAATTHVGQILPDAPLTDEQQQQLYTWLALLIASGPLTLPQFIALS